MEEEGQGTKEHCSIDIGRDIGRWAIYGDTRTWKDGGIITCTICGELRMTVEDEAQGLRGTVLHLLYKQHLFNLQTRPLKILTDGDLRLDPAVVLKISSYRQKTLWK